MDKSEAKHLISAIKTKISKNIFGQEKLIEETLCAFLSEGHILMTGAPGLAKTTLVRVFSKYLGLEFSRIQYTPDLLPSDITGTELLHIDPNTGKRTFEFTKGPIFSNLLLADEINRATPRTQSAMLEAMQERRVTISGKTYDLPAPFMVFATQNPFESEGTFPLPEAQLDRFLVHSLVEYPSEKAEKLILEAHSQSNLVGERKSGLSAEQSVVDARQAAELMELSRSIVMPTEIMESISTLVRMTRPEQNLPDDFEGAVWYGAGPRAGLSLISVAKAFALLEDSETVRWSHVKRMIAPVFRHRVKLVPSAERELGGVDKFIEALVNKLESKLSDSAKGL